jgi:hypothetical protein
MPDDRPRRFRYQPDEEPKRKHRWDEPRAGFVEVRGQPVAKCPAGLSNEEAERLLNEGVEYWPDRGPTEYPQRIYVVHEGVVYRAMPTVPGASYHGFPEHPKHIRSLPEDVINEVLSLARRKNCEDEVRRWMRGK